MTPMRRPVVIRFLALLVLFLARPLSGQPSSTGRIVGRVVDATTGAGIADAGVQVVGTTLGARSGVDGRFTLAFVGYDEEDREYAEKKVSENEPDTSEAAAGGPQLECDVTRNNGSARGDDKWRPRSRSEYACDSDDAEYAAQDRW